MMGVSSLSFAKAPKKKAASKSEVTYNQAKKTCLKEKPKLLGKELRKCIKKSMKESSKS